MAHDPVECCTLMYVLLAAQVQGQVADLTDLQRILQRSELKLSNAQQQNMTVSDICCIGSCLQLSAYGRHFCLC